MTIQFIQIIVNISMIFVCVGLPCGIIWAFVQHAMNPIQEWVDAPVYDSRVEEIASPLTEMDKLMEEEVKEEEAYVLQLVHELSEMSGNYNLSYQMLIRFSKLQLENLAVEVFGSEMMAA